MNILSDITIESEPTIIICLIADSNLNWRRRTEILCELLNLWWPRGTEHCGLSIRMSDVAQNFSDIFFEPHVQHSVGLIQHEISDPPHVCISAFNEIDQSTWSCDENFDSVPQLSLLIASWRTTIDSKTCQLTNIGVSSSFYLDLHN